MPVSVFFSLRDSLETMRPYGGILDSVLYQLSSMVCLTQATGLVFFFFQ